MHVSQFLVSGLKASIVCVNSQPDTPPKLLQPGLPWIDTTIFMRSQSGMLPSCPWASTVAPTTTRLAGTAVPVVSPLTKA